MKTKRKTPSRIRYITRLIIIGMILIIGMLAVYVVIHLPARLHMDEIESITIHDEWSGLMDDAPFVADYKLALHDNELIGTSTFSYGYRPPQPNEDVVIPSEVVEAFIRKINTIRMTEGRYVYYEYMQWTDDYPNISIIIQTERETVEIFTRSQGEQHIPWAVRIGDEMYIVDSPVPAEAFAILQPYLLVDIPDSMEEAANNPWSEWLRHQYD